MSAKAPESPQIIPRVFSRVIRSRRITAVSTNNRMGVIVIETALFIGVDRLNPLKNINMFSTIPKMAHAKMRHQSLVSIFSDFVNKLKIQKRIAAPPTRRTINPKGWITCGIKPLAMV